MFTHTQTTGLLRAWDQTSQTEAVLREVELFDDDLPGAAEDDDRTAYSAGILDDEDESLDSVARDVEYARENHGAVPTRQSARESSAGATAAMDMARERERQAAIGAHRERARGSNTNENNIVVILCAI